MFFVELLFNDCTGECLLANLYFDLIAQLDVAINEGYGTAFLGRDEAIARSDFAHFLAIF